jgi:signal transduction histidine kinase
MVQTMCGFSSATCRVWGDDAAGRYISTEPALHIVNSVREGLSNSLRHSCDTRSTVSLRQLTGSVCPAISDNGIGFNPKSVHRVGHGLDNYSGEGSKGRRFVRRTIRALQKGQGFYSTFQRTSMTTSTSTHV